MLRTSSAPGLAPSTKNQSSNLPGAAENFRSDFGVVARALWPEKTAAELAAIAGKDERTARDWLADRTDPPPILLSVILQRCVRRRR